MMAVPNKGKSMSATATMPRFVFHKHVPMIDRGFDSAESKENTAEILHETELATHCHNAFYGRE